MLKTIIKWVAIILLVIAAVYCLNEVVAYFKAGNTTTGEPDPNVPDNEIQYDITSLLTINLNYDENLLEQTVEEGKVLVIFKDANGKKFVASWDNILLTASSQTFEMPYGKYSYVVTSDNDLIRVEEKIAYIEIDELTESLDINLIIGENEVESTPDNEVEEPDFSIDGATTLKPITVLEGAN